VKFWQIMVWIVKPNSSASSGAYYAKNFLSTIILGQYIAKLFRFLPRIIGQSLTQMVSSESTLGNFMAYLLSFIFFSHVVGSGWYLFALQVSKIYFLRALWSPRYQIICMCCTMNPYRYYIYWIELRIIWLWMKGLSSNFIQLMNVR